MLFLAVFAPAQAVRKQELQFYTEPYKPAAGTTLRRSVFLVDINAVVRNAKGEAVPGLRQRDFQVYDNGKKQKITRFKVLRAAPSIVMRQSAPGQSSPPAAVGTKNRLPSSHAVAGSPAPHYIALFFDDRHTPFGDLRYAQLAAEKFVREDVDPGDRVGVFTASRSVTLNFTGDKQQLLQAIASVHPKPVGTAASNLNPCARYPLSAYTSYLITDQADTEVLGLYTCQSFNPNAGKVMMQRVPIHPPPKLDIENQAQNILHSTEIVALDSLESLESAIAELAQMPGRRVVVLISSGFFTASMRRRLDAVAADALHANVVLDSLDAKGLVATEGENQNMALSGITSPFERMLHEQQLMEENDVMSTLAMDTGGTFFHNDNDLAAGLQQMAAVPEVSYRLGFSPSHMKDDGRYHSLKVKVTAPGSFKVRARPGYFAPVKAKRRGKEKAGTLDREVLATDNIAAFPVHVTARPGRLPSGKTGMQITLRMDPRTLKFQERKGRHLDQLNLVVALFNRAGKFVTGEKGLVDMALKKKTLEGLMRRGLNATIVLEAPEGNYRLRVVIEDLQSHKMFAASRPAGIP